MNLRSRKILATWGDAHTPARFWHYDIMTTVELTVSQSKGGSATKCPHPMRYSSGTGEVFIWDPEKETLRKERVK